jgi:hypothetical protein
MNPFGCEFVLFKYKSLKQFWSAAVKEIDEKSHHINIAFRRPRSFDRDVGPIVR